MPSALYPIATASPARSQEQGAKSHEAQNNAAKNLPTPLLLPRSSALFEPTFFEIHQIGNAGNVVALGETLILLQFFKTRGHEIAPAKF